MRLERKSKRPVHTSRPVQRVLKLLDRGGGGSRASRTSCVLEREDGTLIYGGAEGCVVLREMSRGVIPKISLGVQHRPRAEPSCDSGIIERVAGSCAAIAVAHVLRFPPDVTLTVFVHEQMHWAANTLANTPAAIDEARQRWPNPPDRAHGGAHDARSTWLHFPVCALELAAMTDLLGADRAVAANRAVPWYRWIYDQLLSDVFPWRDLIDRWNLELPAEPPAERDPSHSWICRLPAAWAHLS